MVPQRDRHGRIILDLSFPVFRSVSPTSRRRRRKDEVLQPSVNETTVRLSPEEAVRDLSKVLPRLLRFLQESPTKTPVLLSKLDLADGFWRMQVPEEHKDNVAYVLPNRPGEPTRVVIPSALQMGWAQPPTYFCTATQAGINVMQDFFGSNVTLPQHNLE